MGRSLAACLTGLDAQGSAGALQLPVDYRDYEVAGRHHERPVGALASRQLSSNLNLDYRIENRIGLRD